MIFRTAAVLAAFCLLSSCRQSAEEEVSTAPDREAISALVKPPPMPNPAGAPHQAGALAQIHCGRCHLPPEPSAFNKKLWVNTILPEMGCYMGVHNYIPQYARFMEKGRTAEEVALIQERILYPPQAQVTQQQWDLMLSFYMQVSPEEMPASNNVRPPDLPEGKFEVSFIGPASATPTTTLLRIEEGTGRIFTSDNNDKSLTVLDGSGKVLLQKKGVGAFTAADLRVGQGRQNFLEVGVLDPNDQIAGSLWTNPSGESLDGLAQTSLPLLKRPVSAVWHDFDKDGREEIVVAEYGNKTGQLCMFLEDGEGKVKRKILNAASGNITVKVADMNLDGWDDLVALRAQESEDLLIYYNLGGLEFVQSTALKFPPHWGSNDFELADLNGDVHLDLFLANGDNADSTPVLKNHHGLRFYLNDQKGGFKEIYNLPWHGAYGIQALDFDLDGDLDFVAFSTFPDFEKDQVSVYLIEQTGELEFQPYAVPESVNSRWTVMDVGDVDGDGDADVVLGPFVPGPSKIPALLGARAQGLPGPFLLLSNLAKP